MDKYEYKVRADEIKSLIAEGEYAQAVKIADTIDWRRVKSVMMLCTISDLYKINRRYEDSRNILLLAYDRHPGGRLIVYSLCELSIKLEEYVQAIEYYKEFVQIAPKDTGRYILQYKLYEAQEVSLEERIAVLEEFKKRDYREKWAYELAYLYHRIGLESKCIEECDEMFLWFGDGRYVLKALELKQLHQPLTPDQEAKFVQMRQTGGIIEPEIVAEGNAIKEEASRETEEEDDGEYSRKENVLTDPTQELPSKEIDDIEVKTVDVSQYNTLNLQKELAESMKEFLEGTQDIPAEEIANATELSEASYFVETEEDMMQDVKEEASEEIREEAREESEENEEEADTPFFVSQDTDEMQLIAEDAPVSEEVFFGNTAEVSVGEVISESGKQILQKEVFPENMSEELPYQEDVPEEVIEEDISEEAAWETDPDDGVQMTMADCDPAISGTGVIKTFNRPSGYDEILSQGYDGQIRLIVPEQEAIEKQITGQISIDDIMAEWERIKKENQQKRMEEIKERVKKQTDTLFADFDESSKTGLLEELEKAMISAAMKEEDERVGDEIPRVIKVADIEKEETEEELNERKELEEKAEESVIEAEPEMTDEEPEAFEERAEEAADKEPETFEERAEEAADKEPGTFEERAEEAADKEPETFGERAEETDKEPETFGERAEETDKEPETFEERAEEAADKEPEAFGEIAATEMNLAEEKEETDKAEEWVAVEEQSEETKTEETLTEDRKEFGEKAVEDDRAKGSNKYTEREMTPGEKEQFAAFIHHKKTRKQIVEAIDNISMASYTGNVVISGEEGTGTTELAKLLVKEIQNSDNNFSGKVAKISGETMNKKDVGATLDKLEGGAIIIEDASAMEESTVGALVKELNQEGRGIIALLSDHKQKIDDFLAKNEILLPIFNLRVDVEALNDQTLVRYAKKYALKQEYAIDELGVLALHTRIAEMQTSDHEVTLSEIEELIDEAIYYADKKTPKHFFDVLLGKRYDEEDMIVLRENDFMH